jgi:high-affinity iron transporter
LEALLIIAALLALAKRNGASRQHAAVWWGSAAGIIASLVIAVGLHLALAGAVSGAQRELLEGLIGLVAAGLLFWVSWWLHRAAATDKFQTELAQKARVALASGSVSALAGLAFLAVLREGAETALFYLGMASSISTSDLLTGIALATVLLIVFGFAIIRIGVRLPLRPFFFCLGLLVLAMGVKFVATGIHCLQIAQWLPATDISWLPTVELVGLYPTAETLAGWLAALVLAATVFVLARRPPPAPP